MPALDRTQAAGFTASNIGIGRINPEGAPSGTRGKEEDGRPGVI
jgi:hypothetical protein